jgi:hypothetical protein
VRQAPSQSDIFWENMRVRTKQDYLWWVVLNLGMFVLVILM